jgi:hypothetical protein
MTELSPSAFRRVPAARNAQIKDEIIVTFKTTRDRDYYKSQTFNLAGKKNCSVRLELPNHLLGQHRLLAQAGQELRSKNSGSRTNIKFDDDRQRLVLDYKTKDGRWKRLCPDQAAGALDKQSEGAGIEETTTEDFRDLLSGGVSATGANAETLGGR